APLARAGDGLLSFFGHRPGRAAADRSGPPPLRKLGSGPVPHLGAPRMATTIQLRQIVKAYGDVQVIHGIDLAIEPGEFTVFVGPSGCGKSTLLRMIAGLEPISGGDLLIDGERMND